MDLHDLQRILKDFSEESAKLAEQVKQRKLIAIAARAKLQAVTREAELEKVKTGELGQELILKFRSPCLKKSKSLPYTPFSNKRKSIV